MAWVPYFLDFKAPRKALQMGKLLMGTLTSVAKQNRVAPLLDCLRATCVRMGANAALRTRCVLDQDFESTASDARVLT